MSKKGITLYVRGDDAELTATFLKQAGQLLLKFAHTKEAWKKEILLEEYEKELDHKVLLGAHLLVGGNTLVSMGDKILEKMK